MNKSPQYNQQSKSEAEERCIYQNMENGCLSLYIWKKNSGFHSRKNREQQYPKVVTFSDPSFRKKCIYVYDYAA